jgi:hypothetical protein
MRSLSGQPAHGQRFVGRVAVRASVADEVDSPAVCRDERGQSRERRLRGPALVGREVQRRDDLECRAQTLDAQTLRQQKARGREV